MNEVHPLKRLIGKTIIGIYNYLDDSIFLFTDKKQVFKITAYEGYERGDAELETELLTKKEIKSEFKSLLEDKDIFNISDKIERLIKELIK